MSRLSSVSIIALFFLAACGAPKLTQLDTLTAPQHPESVATNGTYIFVTNFGPELAPQAKDGDGYISRFRMNGELMENRFIADLSAPKGTVIHRGVLYVADIDYLYGYDVENGERIFELSFEGESAFLNGLTVEDDDHLFLSATDNGKVYRVDLEQRSYQALGIPPLRGPNGLAYDAASRSLYVVGFGSDGEANGDIGKVTFEPVKYQRVSDYAGLLDGARLVGDYLYFTDWKTTGLTGVLLKYNLGTREIEPVKGAPLMAGPADFAVGPDQKFAIIPELVGNKVITVRLK